MGQLRQAAPPPPRALDRTTAALNNLHMPQLPQLPHMPTREELVAQAKAMFARTPSRDAIVDRAYELLHDTVGMRLAMALEQRRA